MSYIVGGRPLTPVRVGWDNADDSDLFDAFDDGARWNGFLEPLMTRAQVEVLVAAQARIRAEWVEAGVDLNEQDDLAFDAETGILTHLWAPIQVGEDGQNRDEYHALMKDGVEYWPVGFGWTWMEAE